MGVAPYICVVTAINTVSVELDSVVLFVCAFSACRVRCRTVRVHHVVVEHGHAKHCSTGVAFLTQRTAIFGRGNTARDVAYCRGDLAL